MNIILVLLYLFGFGGFNFVSQTNDEIKNIKLPVTKASKFQFDDPAYLVIFIESNNYKITFLNKNLSTNNVTVIDSFLQKNKSKLDSNKVFASGFTNLEQFNKIQPILLKYGIAKYRTN